MARELKTIQWNVGGAKLLREGANPDLRSSYSEDGLKAVIDFLGQIEPDVTTLQETHATLETSQTQAIAEALGYEYFVNDTFSDSHIELGQKLGQAIISKHAIISHESETFLNPLWQMVQENGCVATCHDKGLSSCEVRLPAGVLQVQNLHLIPFRAFGKDPRQESNQDAKEVLKDVQAKIGSYDGPRLIQGDFNIDCERLRYVLYDLFNTGVSEVAQTEATTPRERRLDHIIYSGMTLVRSLVVKKTIKTDHYPIISTFEL